MVVMVVVVVVWRGGGGNFPIRTPRQWPCDLSISVFFFLLIWAVKKHCAKDLPPRSSGSLYKAVLCQLKRRPLSLIGL